MSDEAKDAATRIVDEADDLLRGDVEVREAMSGDTLTVARAYLDAATEIERLRAARNAVLEEAAKVCEAAFSDDGWHPFMKSSAEVCADNIRALKAEATNPTKENT